MVSPYHGSSKSITQPGVKLSAMPSKTQLPAEQIDDENPMIDYLIDDLMKTELPVEIAKETTKSHLDSEATHHSKKRSFVQHLVQES